MTARKILKRIHLVATIWFIVCVGYILAVALRHVGLRWWLVFSLSGHSPVVILILAGLFLFAFLRGVGGPRHVEEELPLASSDCYLGSYVSAPLLGGLAGVLAAAGIPEIGKFLFCVALGTLATTFLVWIVIDPLAGVIEKSLRASRKHRRADGVIP